MRLFLWFSNTVIQWCGRDKETSSAGAGRAVKTLLRISNDATHPGRFLFSFFFGDSHNSWWRNEAEKMSLLKKNQLKTQRSQLGPSKWLILLILCPVCFTMTAAEMGCPVWGIIDGFKREGLERGKVSFILIFSIFLLPITLYLFFSILVVGFNSEAMPIFWDCQANVGVNTIRENSVEIHFFLCQPQIPCLPCKDDDENTIFSCFGISKSMLSITVPDFPTVMKLMWQLKTLQMPHFSYQMCQSVS